MKRALPVLFALAQAAACQGGRSEPSGRTDSAGSGAQGQPASGKSAPGARPDPRKPRPQQTAAVPDAAVPGANLEACRAAAARVPSLPRHERTVALLQGCQPCGDWGPLLAWDIPTSDGGPTRAMIEQGMLACDGFCQSSAKQRFLEAVESERGRPTRKPWRLLGELCREAVSAAQDTRYMSAPYFAFDRVARMIGDAALLSAIELPLPAVSLSGNGADLPTSALMVPDAGPVALTIDAANFSLGTLPIAKLSPRGVEVSGEYPGPVVEPKALTAAIAAAIAASVARGAPAGQQIAVLAPRELPAQRIVDAAAAAPGHDLRLAVADLTLRNWIIPHTVPVSLTASPARGRAAGIRLVLDGAAVEAVKTAQAMPRDKLAAGPVTIAVERSATAASLANLLGALGYLDVKSVVLATSAAGPRR